MGGLKTRKTRASVSAFLAGIPDEKKRRDSRTVLDMMKKITGEPPKMWGPSIVGFGGYRYRYASGREGDWFLTGFSPRKQALTLYIMSGFGEYDASTGSEALLKRLGKFKTGKACLYINRLEDVDLEVLAELIRRSVRQKAQMGC